MDDAIGRLFELPEVNLDTQLPEMLNGEPQSNTTSGNISSGTNATEKDDGLDAALIDLIPIP